VLGNFVTEADVPHILVEDTVQGLSWLARGLVREERARGMVSLGVTGSSGKTSTKDLLAQVLEAKGTTVAPTGSQNNEIGVPLTACRIDGSTQFLVSEMGSRGVGHIEWLTSLVGLDVGIVLNIGRAHVGEFGGLERTARAKSEIITGLGPEGWAVLNADDPSCRAMRDETAAQVAWFGEGDLPEGDLQVAARDVVCGESARAARTRGIDVILLDDRGTGNGLTDDAQKTIINQAIRALDDARKGQVVIRLLPPRQRPRLLSIVTDNDILTLDADGALIR